MIYDSKGHLAIRFFRGNLRSDGPIGSGPRIGLGPDSMDAPAKNVGAANSTLRCNDQVDVRSGHEKCTLQEWKHLSHHTKQEQGLSSAKR